MIFNYLGNLPRDSVGIQTQNLLIRSQMLYSVELRNHPVLMSCIKFDDAKLLNIFICQAESVFFYHKICNSRFWKKSRDYSKKRSPGMRMPSVTPKDGASNRFVSPLMFTNRFADMRLYVATSEISPRNDICENVLP